MNENARAWVKALRSGEYKQGTGALNRGGKFCCLGVACDLFTKTNWIEVSEGYTGHRYDGAEDLLPDVVREWLGLIDAGGVVEEGKALHALNDSGSTFHEIAAHIESEPAGLFEVSYEG